MINLASTTCRCVSSFYLLQTYLEFTAQMAEWLERPPLEL